MNKSRMGIAVAVTALALFSTGCFRAIRLEHIGYEIADACPDATFKKDMSLSLGGVSWGIIKSIAMTADKHDQDIRQYVGCLDKIELVVYNVDGISNADVRPIGEIVKESLDDDWQLMIKTADKDDLVWIHYREDDGKIREMNITSYDGDEFVIVRLSGHLDDLMEMAMEDHGSFTDKIVHGARN